MASTPPTIIAWPYPELPFCIKDAIVEVHWRPDIQMYFEMGPGLNPLDPEALVKFILARASKPGEAWVYVHNHLAHWVPAKKAGLSFRIIELIPRQTDGEMEVGTIHHVDPLEENPARVWTSLRYSSTLAEIPSIYAREGRVEGVIH